MIARSLLPVALALASPAGCQCANADTIVLESETSSGSASEASSGSASESDGGSTGASFDASRWIGRYHFESVHLAFGERGDSLGALALANFEILPDSEAWLFYDECNLEEPIVISYAWKPDDEGWLELSPGPGESSLRYNAATGLETLRVRLIEPCRDLRFEIDGHEDHALPFSPGASCWVDKCTVPGIMQVDYCPGEEPEEVCE